MLLVIVGHVVLGSVHENIVRYIIYAFHMPLFIGLSGYLINAVKLKGISLSSLFSRYWRRALLPFALAFCFYTGVLLLHAFQEDRISQALIISYLLTPYYHLWFVPSLVIWVVALWVMRKLQLSTRWLALIFLVITASWATFYPENVPILGSFLTLLLSKKVVYFFAFFLFGVWLKTPESRKLISLVNSFNILPAALVMLCAVIYMVNIGPDKELVKGLAWLLMNLCLLVIAVAWIQRENKQKQKKSSGIRNHLISMGRNSLPIYLWHMLPMFLLKGFDIHERNTTAYYLVSAVSVTLIVLILIRLENKSSISNRLFYGH